MILDNRVHRTLRISTDQQEYPLTPSSPYKVLLKVIGNKDYLVVSKNGVAIGDPIPLTKTFTPPNCPSPVTQVHNSSCQFNFQIDDGLYRIIELRQNLVDSHIGDITLLGATTTDVPALYSHKLLFKANSLVTTMADGGGFKVPPDLSL